VIQAENDISSDSPIFVASVQTLASKRWRGALPPADLVVWDEVHHIKARTFLEIDRFYASAFKLGLTATPERGDGSPLGDVLDSIVAGATVSELVTLGHLVPARVYAPPQILDSRTLAMSPIDAYRRYTAGKRTIVFATTVEHAEKIAAEFREQGIHAEHVSGSMSDRPRIIERYTAGEFSVLVNVALLIEGWDDPTTEAAIAARRFTHAGGWLQMCGRTLRPASGKTIATIVDTCGSALVHGTPDLERTYSLEGKAIRANDREPLRQCPGCGGVFSASTGEHCPYCATALPIAHRSLPRNGNVGVGEVTKKADPTSWPMKAKHGGTCAGCGSAIERGAWIVYSKLTKTAKHAKCAARAARSAA
jgi:superfamily II DNA or RNA helicase